MHLIKYLMVFIVCLSGSIHGATCAPSLSMIGEDAPPLVKAVVSRNFEDVKNILDLDIALERGVLVRGLEFSLNMDWFSNSKNIENQNRITEALLRTLETKGITAADIDRARISDKKNSLLAQAVFNGTADQCRLLLAAGSIFSGYEKIKDPTTGTYGSSADIWDPKKMLDSYASNLMRGCEHTGYYVDVSVNVAQKLNFLLRALGIFDGTMSYTLERAYEVALAMLEIGHKYNILPPESKDRAEMTPAEIEVRQAEIKAARAPRTKAYKDQALDILDLLGEHASSAVDTVKSDAFEPWSPTMSKEEARRDYKRGFEGYLTRLNTYVRNFIPNHATPEGLTEEQATERMRRIEIIRSKLQDVLGLFAAAGI